MTLEGNRNALLALHFHEGGTARTAAHAGECAECRAYLRAIAELEAAIVGADDTPPADLRESVLERALSQRQAPAPAKVRPAAGAAGLLGLLPVMAMLMALVHTLGTTVAGWVDWQALVPQAPNVAPFAVAVVVLLVAGGLASLAMAPALVLENRKV
jgi:predicted anti-sigma-YlaC factor YlaD